MEKCHKNNKPQEQPDCDSVTGQWHRPAANMNCPGILYSCLKGQYQNHSCWPFTNGGIKLPKKDIVNDFNEHNTKF